MYRTPSPYHGRRLVALLIAAALMLLLGALGRKTTWGEGIDGPAPVPSSVDAQPGCGAGVTSGPGVIATSEGAVRGVAEGGTLAYKGIPYAAPPVGERRWRPPAEPVCHAAELAATAFGPACPQTGAGGAAEGDEDCLTLNIWAPAAETGVAALRPVLVFIHGGGNIQGASSQPVYDGRYLAERGGGVVVTINYRLGALGFLAHPALSAESGRGVSGNYGILDQIAALRWVQRNITAFGGDPNRVLIFGESAGGVNVCVLVASPLANGLFSAALIESGGCVQGQLARAEQFGGEFAGMAGCAGAANILACLRSKSAAELLDAYRARISIGTLGQLPFAPNVDGFVLTGSPIEVIRSGAHNHVPFVIGANADETAGLNPPPVPNEAAYKELLTRSLGQRAADAVLARYPATEYASPRQAYIAATSDAAFICPTRRVARAAAQAQSEPVYRYFFTHALDGGAGRALGAFHGLELAFVFGTLGRASSYSPSADELSLADAMVGYWSRFAASDDPNGGGATVWPAYAPATDPYLRLDTSISSAEGVRTAQCDFWDSFGS
jgi:para-nitrobenzyl esterase